MKNTAAAIVRIISLVLIIAAITGCTKENVTSKIVQTSDAGQAAENVDIGDSYGGNESSRQCFFDGESIGRIFTGRGSL